jgi:hypothetical protein
MQCKLKAGLLHEGERYCGRHAPDDTYETDDYISPEEAERIEEMATSLASSGLSFTNGRSEIVVIADDCGERLKAMIDYLEDTRIRELKKTSSGSVSLEACERSIEQFGWHIQTALYQRMVRAVTGRLLPVEWTLTRILRHTTT